MAVVRELIVVLGPRLVALIAGLDATYPLWAWMRGEEQPQYEQRLRHALRATQILLRGDPELAAPWFEAENHLLNGEPPALALRDGPPEVGSAVVFAALAFVGA